MLIVTATNITKENGRQVIANKVGLADYDVWVGINHHCIWRGEIKGHTRDSGAAVLLRLIADRMERDDNRSLPIESAVDAVFRKVEAGMINDMVFGTGTNKPVGLLRATTPHIIKKRKK